MRDRPLRHVSRRAACAQSGAPARRSAHRQTECARDGRRRRASRRRRSRPLQRPCFPAFSPSPCIRLGAKRHRRPLSLRNPNGPRRERARLRHRDDRHRREQTVPTMSVVRKSRTCSMGITRSRTSASTSATTSVRCPCPCRRQCRGRCRCLARHQPDRRCRGFDPSSVAPLSTTIDRSDPSTAPTMIACPAPAVGSSDDHPDRLRSVMPATLVRHVLSPPVTRGNNPVRSPVPTIVACLISAAFSSAAKAARTCPCTSSADRSPRASRAVPSAPASPHTDNTSRSLCFYASVP